MRAVSNAVWAVSVNLFVSGFIQAQPAARNQIAGTVAAVDPAAKQVTLRSDKGESVTVSTGDRTLFLRIPPGETDPKKGTKITLSDIAAGDRAVAVSKQAMEGTHMEASAILVMTKADLAQVRQKTQDDWRRRGTTGMVTEVNAGGKTITFKAGSRTVVANTSDKTVYYRYSPDSAKFADAAPSTFAAIQAGDQVRVLGDRSPDGAAVTAEKVVFGTFRQIAATIQSIDAGTGELKVTDLATRKPLTIRINSGSTMRKLPEMQAQMLARRYGPGGRASSPPAGAVEGRGGGGEDIGQMLDRLSPLPISELKAGEAVMVSTTMGSDPTRVTAITLLAGVEPLLRASPAATRDIMGGWNLGAGDAGDEEQ